eukprot:1811201-Pleurochrysis_carterae.AAC.2
MKEVAQFGSACLTQCCLLESKVYNIYIHIPECLSFLLNNKFGGLHMTGRTQGTAAGIQRAPCSGGKYIPAA